MGLAERLLNEYISGYARQCPRRERQTLIHAGICLAARTLSCFLANSASQGAPLCCYKNTVTHVEPYRL